LLLSYDSVNIRIINIKNLEKKIMELPKHELVLIKKNVSKN